MVFNIRTYHSAWGDGHTHRRGLCESTPESHTSTAPLRICPPLSPNLLVIRVQVAAWPARKSFRPPRRTESGIYFYYIATLSSDPAAVCQAEADCTCVSAQSMSGMAMCQRTSCRLSITRPRDFSSRRTIARPRTIILTISRKSFLEMSENFPRKPGKHRTSQDGPHALPRRPAAGALFCA